jgi:hypothetical protein
MEVMRNGYTNVDEYPEEKSPLGKSRRREGAGVRGDLKELGREILD